MKDPEIFVKECFSREYTNQSKKEHLESESSLLQKLPVNTKASNIEELSTLEAKN